MEKKLNDAELLAFTIKLLEQAEEDAIGVSEPGWLAKLRDEFDQLTRPAIHPDVPVRIKAGNGGVTLCRAGSPTAKGVEDLDVLIPAPMVMEMAREGWDHSACARSSHLAWWERRIATYTQEGPQ